MEKSLVSIGLPVFNGGPYLAKALDSLLTQSYPHTEIIISDNSDETEAVARRYCAQFPRIRYSRNASNIGASLNWQHVLTLARGEFFMWAAHDDLWEPTFVAEIMEGLLSDSEYVTGFCQFDKFSHSDGRTQQRLRQPPEFRTDGNRAKNQVIYLTQPCYWMIHGIHRIDVLRRIVRIRSRRDVYDMFYDVYVPFRLLGEGKPYVVRRLLFHSGKREGQLSAKYRAQGPRILQAAWRHLSSRLAVYIILHPRASLADRVAMVGALFDMRRRIKEKSRYRSVANQRC